MLCFPLQRTKKCSEKTRSCKSGRNGTGWLRGDARQPHAPTTSTPDAKYWWWVGYAPVRGKMGKETNDGRLRSSRTGCSFSEKQPTATDLRGTTSSRLLRSSVNSRLTSRLHSRGEHPLGGPGYSTG